MLQQKGFFCSRFFRTNSIVSSICVALCVKNVFSVCLFICGVLLFSWPLESQKETLWVWLVSFSWCVLTMMMICVCIFFVYSALGAHAYWPCCHCSIHPFWANHINFRQFSIGLRHSFVFYLQNKRMAWTICWVWDWFWSQHFQSLDDEEMMILYVSEVSIRCVLFIFLRLNSWWVYWFMFGRMLLLSCENKEHSSTIAIL